MLSTIAREMLVAVSGVVLVMFILAHLAGNFFIFGGPDAYNSYAEHLHSLGILLLFARLGLIVAFLTHVGFTVWLALDNRAARGTRYAVRSRAGTNFAKTTMLYSGIIVFTFISLHIADFALADQTGPRTLIATASAGVAGENEELESLGVYGLVWNSFANPVRAVFYIIALFAVGLHFSNAVSTIWVTLGALSDPAIKKVNRAAQVVGAIVVLSFGSIPLYVLAVTYLSKAGS